MNLIICMQVNKPDRFIYAISTRGLHLKVWKIPVVVQFRKGSYAKNCLFKLRDNSDLASWKGQGQLGFFLRKPGILVQYMNT